MAIIYSKSAQNCILLQRICQRYFTAQVSTPYQIKSHIIPIQNHMFVTRVRYFSSKKQSALGLWSHEQPGCPKELSIHLKNESQNCHINKSGNYSVATSDRINGRSYWVSSDDKHAIWYENKSWRVGDIEDLGTGICGIYSVAPGEPHWPNHEINWRYFNGKEWIFASKNIKMEGRNFTEVPNIFQENEGKYPAALNKFKKLMTKKDVTWGQDPKGGRSDLLLLMTLTMWAIPAVLLIAAMKCANQNIDMPELVRDMKINSPVLRAVGFGDDADRKRKFKMMEDRLPYTSPYSGNTYDNIRR